MGLGRAGTSGRSVRSLNRVVSVIFDLDDTLIDSARGMAIAEARVSEMLFRYLLSQQIDVNGERLLREIPRLDRIMNRERLYDRSYWWQNLLHRLDLGVTLPLSLTSEVTREYWSNYGEWALPFPETMSTLEALLGKGYLLGLVTDTDGTRGVKARCISLLSFRRAFTVVVIAGEDTPETKPSIAPFRLAASRLGLTCAECVFVGDKPFTDIRGARRAGMKSILIRRGTWRSEEQPDFTIDSLLELCRIL